MLVAATMMEGSAVCMRSVAQMRGFWHRTIPPYRAWEGGKEQDMVDICAGMGTHALVANDLCLCPVGLFDKGQEALQAAAVIRQEFLPTG